MMMLSILLLLSACLFAHADYPRQCRKNEITRGHHCHCKNEDCSQMKKTCYCNRNCGCLTERYTDRKPNLQGKPNLECFKYPLIRKCNQHNLYYFDWKNNRCRKYHGDCPAKPANTFKTLEHCNHHCENKGKWRRFSSKVCFGATRNSFGTIRIPRTGHLVALNLTYLGGKVTCNKHKKACYSRWGCDCFGKEFLSVFVTDDRNQVLFPTTAKDNAVWYRLPGFSTKSNSIVFENFANPMNAEKGDLLKIWYGEDLHQFTFRNNEGEVCVKVNGILA